jgi:hypothetical protein
LWVHYLNIEYFTHKKNEIKKTQQKNKQSNKEKKFCSSATSNGQVKGLEFHKVKKTNYS